MNFHSTMLHEILSTRVISCSDSLRQKTHTISKAALRHVPPAPSTSFHQCPSLTFDSYTIDGLKVFAAHSVLKPCVALDVLFLGDPLEPCRLSRV